MADRHSQKALSDFLAESQEVIDVLDRGLLRLEDTRHGQEADQDTLNAVFRAAHSLKGLSAIFGVERMTKLAHALEDRLDQVRMGRRPLDAPTLDLLLAAPGIFSRIIAEEAASAPPDTGRAVERLAGLLLEVFTPAAIESAAPVAADASPAATELDIDDAVRAVLTAYEEHRLQASLQKGLDVHRVQVSFDLASFGAGLDVLKKQLKPLGEVISTLPSPNVTDPDVLAFDVLFATGRPLDEVRAAAGPSAVVDRVPRRPVTTPAASPETSPETEPPSRGARPFAESAPVREKSAAPGAPPSPPAPLFRPDPAVGPVVRDRPGVRASPAAPPPDAGPTTRSNGPPTPMLRAADPPPMDADASLRSVTQAVRVDIAKLDRLMNLVGGSSSS